MQMPRAGAAEPLGDPPERADPFAAPAGTAWSRPSERFAWYRRFQVAFVAIVALILAGYYGGRLGVAGGAVGVVLVLAAATAAMLLVERSVRAWGFTEAANDLLLTHGVLWRRLVVLPYGRLQSADVTVNQMQRVLGIATVRLHTAAATTDACIPGLALPDAARLRDRLADRGEARSTGL